MISSSMRCGTVALPVNSLALKLCNLHKKDRRSCWRIFFLLLFEPKEARVFEWPLCAAFVGGPWHNGVLRVSLSFAGGFETRRWRPTGAAATRGGGVRHRGGEGRELPRARRADAV